MNPVATAEPSKYATHMTHWQNYPSKSGVPHRQTISILKQTYKVRRNIKYVANLHSTIDPAKRGVEKNA
jgi:hypothetical protein